ncbi:hypothetical protein CMQ_1379 [Grosmannia clavigera kw1407]|uniref:HD/PDEase domain-containing protein n=1 Tax=Grosmannia clavigera (strain kw1407 / UAMH 11150) TaxID=655863 RepID=F0XDX5_GROCL|nr:uncharacterized protein CMQ_1379 [Grosmannia clavigera kw1407]EFX04451.1 hypothetical protein CMQ_1379 [Grosmannia clavigera kw1407]
MTSPTSGFQVSLTADPLVKAVTAAVRLHMSRYDGSHDFSHIRRVVGTAAYLAEHEQQQAGPSVLNLRLITLCALLHDVGDHKYLDIDKTASSSGDADNADDALHALFPDPGARATAVVLRRCGAPEELVRLVPLLCQHVSWSFETKTAASIAATADLIARYPELAIVQDADRLDSIGAIGIGRVFAYGAARGGRTLQTSVDHFDDKLLHVGSRMKTATGRRLARDRTDRLHVFLQWYRDEDAVAVADPLEPVPVLKD